MLFDKNGKPLQPPEFPGSEDDPGLFGVNYKNEPLQFRLGPDCDPAYSFSSYVNGDPITPIFKGIRRRFDSHSSTSRSSRRIP